MRCTLWIYLQGPAACFHLFIIVYLSLFLSWLIFPGSLSNFFIFKQQNFGAMDTWNFSFVCYFDLCFVFSLYMSFLTTLFFFSSRSFNVPIWSTSTSFSSKQFQANIFHQRFSDIHILILAFYIYWYQSPSELMYWLHWFLKWTFNTIKWSDTMINAPSGLWNLVKFALQSSMLSIFRNICWRAWRWCWYRTSTVDCELLLL